MKKFTVTVKEFISVEYANIHKASARNVYGILASTDAKLLMDHMRVSIKLLNANTNLEHCYLGSIEEDIQWHLTEFKEAAKMLFECKLHYPNKFLVERMTRSSEIK